MEKRAKNKNVTERRKEEEEKKTRTKYKRRCGCQLPRCDLQSHHKGELKYSVI